VYLVAVNAPEDGTYLSNASWSLVILYFAVCTNMSTCSQEAVWVYVKTGFQRTSNVQEAAAL